eukprot:211409-Pyramimonas_sp.AAC.1
MVMVDCGDDVGRGGGDDGDDDDDVDAGADDDDDDDDDKYNEDADDVKMGDRIGNTRSDIPIGNEDVEKSYGIVGGV